MPEPSEYVRIEVPREQLPGIRNALWEAIVSLNHRTGQARFAIHDLEYRREVMPGLSELEIVAHLGMLTHQVSILYALRDLAMEKIKEPAGA